MLSNYFCLHAYIFVFIHNKYSQNIDILCDFFVVDAINRSTALQMWHINDIDRTLFLYYINTNINLLCNILDQC